MDSEKDRQNSIAILGLGKVGTAMGFLLRSAGYRITAVASRSEQTLHRGIPYTGGEAFTDYAGAAALADCIFITTSDDAIADVCAEISAKGALNPDKKVIHMSGAGGLDLLESAHRNGVPVGSIHPIQSFPTIESAIRNIPGSAFGITSTQDIENWCVGIVKDIGGTPLLVAEIDKPLYHAAACMASNYLVTLMHMVLETYRALGLDHDTALRSFWPLITATLQNIKEQGPAAALTGPIARGDSGTIRKHLATLRERRIEFLPAYSALGILTADLALLKKSLPTQNAELIKKLLEGGADHGNIQDD